jgi:predicted HicB family RNase H-like nuclease
MPRATPENKYAYRVFWSEEDGEFVGHCVEFPSLSWLAETRQKALDGIERLVRETLVEMNENGETPPQPVTGKTFSGTFKVRIPPMLHRSLALEAAENRVSLNRLVSAKLASGFYPRAA